MEIQSLSIVIPTKRCVNNCPFCVSKMHDNEYENNFSIVQLKKRIKFAVNNGVNNVILTGTGEVLQNKKFLRCLATLFEELNHPFPDVELQTTGVFLNKFEEVFDNDGNLVPFYYNIELLKRLQVNTISLSISDIFCDENNMKLIGAPKNLHFKLVDLIKLLKEKNFNVRASLNMGNNYNEAEPGVVINLAEYMGADQITFRKLYHGGSDSPEDKWVRSNSCDEDKFEEFYDYVRQEGEKLYPLPYGPFAYSIMRMSTVIDNDCMGKKGEEALKYLILREDGRLYCRWDDKGSLIF